MSADQQGTQTCFSPNEIARQDSETSGGSSIADSTFYNNLTGKLISHGDMEFERSKKLVFNAALRKYNPKAFAVVETVNDIKSAIKYCRDNNVSQTLVSTKFSSFTTSLSLASARLLESNKS